MSTFTLDTSGAVCAPLSERGWAEWSGVLDVGEAKRWSDLDPFPQGCIEALFASLPTLCETCQGNGEVVTDWGTYLKPPEGAEADAGTATCAACDGQGRTTYAFSDLAPEALALILKDCAAWRAEFSGDACERSAGREDMGREFWRIRQENKRRTFPPLTPYLREDGKVALR